MTWEDPVVFANDYEIPLENIVLSYSYNDDQFLSGSCTIPIGIKNYSFNIGYGKSENDFVNIKVQTEDKLGRRSDGKTSTEYCFACFRCISSNITTKIRKMKKSGKIIISGDISCSAIANACSTLRETEQGKSVQIDLDLSNATNFIDIPEDALRNNSSLRSVILPDGVKTIGKNAFYYCVNLTNINIPDSVETIGDYAFSHCHSLESITTPNNLRGLGIDAFSNCINLQSANIPYDAGAYGLQSTFMNCTNLKTVNIGTIISPYGIGQQTFKNCTNLTTITIYYSKCIDSSAFMRCESLEEIVIPDSTRYIGQEAFYECSNLSKVTIGSDITTILRLAFSGCSNLEEVVFKKTSKKWYETSNAISWGTQQSALNGTSKGYLFSQDAARNAELLRDTYTGVFLYSEGYQPLMGY